ncbi:hypothetical protein MKX01_008896 [Papaver californicum]|nr:hypothetical protein MKX01_008896 [Papaver californicum]
MMVQSLFRTILARRYHSSGLFSCNTRRFCNGRDLMARSFPFVNDTQTPVTLGLSQDSTVSLISSTIWRCPGTVGFCGLAKEESALSVLDSDDNILDDVVVDALPHNDSLELKEPSDDVNTRTDKRKAKGTKKKSIVEFSKVDADLLPTVILVGRPNVGKSALFNRFIQRREALVYNTPDDHVIRDIREGISKLGDLRFRVVDSAGLETAATSGSILDRTTGMTSHVLARSQFAMFLIDVRSKQEKGPGSLSVMQSRKNLMRAHVIALVLDTDEIAKSRCSMNHAEVVIARRAVEEGRGLVVIVNKMDLLRGKENAKLYEKVIKAVPEKIQTVIPQVMSRHSWKDQAPKPKIKYFTQVKARPPTFVAFLHGKTQLSDTDIRFLTSSLKEDFDLGGIPIRIMQRGIPRKADAGAKGSNSCGRMTDRIISDKRTVSPDKISFDKRTVLSDSPTPTTYEFPALHRDSKKRRKVVGDCHLGSRQAGKAYFTYGFVMGKC